MRAVAGKSGSRIRFDDGTELVNFASSDYLGLARAPEVLKAAHGGARDHGFGTASAPTITGRTVLHRRLEEVLCRFTGTEASVCFNSGWSANVGLLSALLRPGDAILSDRFNHASIIDGLRLAPAGVTKLVYDHLDLVDLRRKLGDCVGARRRFVVTDGVFSMRGSVARLGEIAEACRACDATLIVDDAHGLAAVGQTGRGTVEHAGLAPEGLIVTGSFGKGLGGAAGGFVAGPRQFVADLAMTARPSMFSTTLPAFVAAGVIRAVELIDEHPKRLANLRRNIEAFDRATRGAAGGDPAVSPIFGIRAATNASVDDLKARFGDQGIFVIGFQYPVVPKGETMIRFQVTASHDEDDIKRATTSIREILGPGQSGSRCLAC